MNGLQIDVFDHLRSFAYETVFKRDMFEFETDFDINAAPQAKWKWKTRSSVVDLKKAQELANHIDHCMLKFTTYFTIGRSNVDSDD